MYALADVTCSYVCECVCVCVSKLDGRRLHPLAVIYIYMSYNLEMMQVATNTMTVDNTLILFISSPFFAYAIATMQVATNNMTVANTYAVMNILSATW